MFNNIYNSDVLLSLNLQQTTSKQISHTSNNSLIEIIG